MPSFGGENLVCIVCYKKVELKHMFTAAARKTKEPPANIQVLCKRVAFRKNLYTEISLHSSVIKSAGNKNRIEFKPNSTMKRNI